MRMLTIGELYMLDNTILEEYVTLGEWIVGRTFGLGRNVVTPVDLSGDFTGLILKECATLECIVQNPDLLKELIRLFLISRKQSYLRLVDTTIQEYNIIHNFDRNEEYTDEITGTANGSNTSNETGTGSATQENSKATFENPVHLKIADQIDNTATNSTERTDETTQNTTTSVKHSAHLYGNIGVTTTQQMLEEERKLLQYSVIRNIVEEFKNEFCILIY